LVWWQALGRKLAEEHSNVFLYEPGGVVGPQDHARLEAQRCIGKRLYDHTVSMNLSRHRLRKDGDAYVVRYQVHCLLWRKDIVSMFGGDGLTSGCIHNRLMQEWMNPFRKQNPLVLCQILENQAFFVSSGVVLWKCSVERSRSKWHSRDLGILRGRCH
jgi:hypothetical protein